MKIGILTIFPNFFDGVFQFGVVGQARKKSLLQIEIVDLREFAEDSHRTVDDRPYGGGAGMVMKPEPFFRAVESLTRAEQEAFHIALLSPSGAQFDQRKAKELSLKTRLLLLCGRYEGVDHRVAERLAHEEISIGDYVLSGGELAAAVVVDAVARLIPGVVGEGQSVLKDSFMEESLAHPQFTRPADFRGWRVPDVLLSGDHEAIRKWREEQALQQTRRRRPDLLTESNAAGEGEQS
ncbi:MAG TPA: tRNA (guanosine(37)-N1)-methyltransferase TrmD [Acidobacteriota bacterium]|nr:tRNA (guanosine(37)-N1)-methyltransferase TrmD [Acidobacteriota bacterium]